MVGEYYTPTVLPLEKDRKLREVGIKLLNAWVPSILLVTLGSDGMAMFERNGDPIHIPTAAKEVYDVSGAGDTVIATFVISMLAGATALEAADIANHAAGVVVAHVGTVPVHVDELVQCFG